MDLYKKLLLVLLLLLKTSMVWAEPRVVIDQDQVNLSDFRMGYHVDQSQALTYEEVSGLPFKETGSKTSLGTNARVTWFKLILDNASSLEQQLFVHLPHAYHVRSVDFYQERDGVLVHSEPLDMDRTAESDLMYRGTAVYPLTLPADQSTTLYLRSHSYSHQWFAVEVLDEQASRRALISINTDIALMVGMMLALVFYNGLLYFATSKKENIFYSLYLISGLVWIALSYGLIASVFDVYGTEIFKLNISLITMPIFLLLFMMAIFETKAFYPTEHRFLQALILLLSGTLVWGIFDISAALKPASSLAALMMVVTFSVSISLYRKGHPLVKYFLIGHSFFVVFNGIAVLVYKGLIPPSYLSSHGVGIGIVLEALTLAFIISHRIKILEDIRSSQDELKKQAATDPLTKLYNRRFFFSEADYLLELAKNSRTPLSILMVDIDHFKSVNDSYGHACGDQVIIELAHTLKKQSRAKDVVARFGGEEFVVLLPDADLQEASRCAERIRAAVQTLEVTINVNDIVRSTVSIGVAEISVGHESVEAALNRADKALYDAKKSGRNRVLIEGPELGELEVV
ncbi:MAG TPA: GGDEF domain-containing protein [Pseudomonas xinjiangensis]|uniref:diguanylate cyclase n=2 Tax=root TaxID=1 RepID=A0A7V1BN89_9GAMM|nr:GGDEF domain-containing protein [Halopseudomonas xinjiangensis]HEC47460.1 GGDEF domain-containing protein [Halopseudomonas xinjiangensis]